MNSLQQDNLTLNIEHGRFSFLQDERLGWRELGCSIQTQFGEEVLVQSEVTSETSTLILHGTYPHSGIEEVLRFSLGQHQTLIVERILRNPGSASVTITDAAVGMTMGAGMPVFAHNHLWNARFAHLDNLRTERFPWCRPEFPYVRPLPREATWFGNQESQPLPVLLLTSDTYSEMLVEGQLAQDRTRMRWRLQAAPDRSLFADYRTSWQVLGGSVLLQANQKLTLEPLFYQILADTHPQDALQGYFRELLNRNTFPQKANILHSKAFYCSWNYGIMQDISAGKLRATAEFIGKSLPGIKHFLIDGGWQGREAVSSPDCSNFYLPESRWCDQDKFPGGMDGMAADLRACGVVPAIWWTPSVNLSSTLAKEHPEWLARDANGAPFRIGKSGYFDLSLPGPREYLKKVWDIIFKRWGYEAMKMDFWCQAFESESIRYASGTAMEWRDWLLTTLCTYLPEDGFLMTCVATAHGNVLLGRHAHTYRCCIDVGNCAWHEHLWASCWVQPLLPFPGRETCLLSVDGLGVNQALSDAENLHRLTYGFITMGSLEIDGRLEQLKPHHVDWLRRLTKNIDRGYPVKCADEQAYTGNPFPSVLYVDYPETSPTYQRGVRKHIALFNWGNEERYAAATSAQLGLEGETIARDFWTDASITIPASGIAEVLPARSARLYEITGNNTRHRGHR